VFNTKSLIKNANFLEIRYEDFCADQLTITKQIIQFDKLD